MIINNPTGADITGHDGQGYPVAGTRYLIPAGATIENVPQKDAEYLQRVYPWLELTPDNDIPETDSEEESEEEDVKDYSTFTLKELRAECDALGIEYDPKAKKGDLVTLLG